MAKFIASVKTADRPGVGPGHVITIVRKLLTWLEAGCFAHDLVAFHHETCAIGMMNDPLATEERDRAVGFVANRDEINKGVRFVLRQALSTIMVVELIQSGGEPGQGDGIGAGHNSTRNRRWRS